jgi:Protein of unknwon function (DUF3310)
MPDQINQPSHYTQGCSPLTRSIVAARFSMNEGHEQLDGECLKFIESWCLDYGLGNAVKYLWRCGLKGAAETDLRKALFYMKRYDYKGLQHGRAIESTEALLDKLLMPD